MKSSLLARQLDQIFGPAGEQSLMQALDRLPPEFVHLGQGIRKFLQLADLSYVHQGEALLAQAAVSGDVFSEWDWPGRRILSGRGWLRLLGYRDDRSADTLAAWQKLLHPDDKAAVLAALAGHLHRRNSLFEVECRMLAQEGDWIPVLLRGRATQRDAEGVATRLLVMHRDISEAKRAQAGLVAARDAAEAASRARGAFLANMSHEIRTPMNAIIGMAELVAETPLSGEQKHYVNTMRSSAEALMNILNDILDLSKIEAGKLAFETIPFSLDDLVLEAARVIAVSAQRKGLEVVVDLAGDVPRRLVGDPTRLRQVLMNLLGNAVKFTETGEIVLTVSAERIAESGVVLDCRVRDTGIGIPPDKQQAVFEAFSQADDSTTRRFGGTGLGLTISTRLVQMMGGRLRLESAPGRGSVFAFDARFGVEAATAATLPDVHCGKRALLVEPQASSARCIADLLQQLGVAVEVVSDARVAGPCLREAAAVATPWDFLLVSAAVLDADPAPPAFLAGAGAACRISLLTTQTPAEQASRLRVVGFDRQLVKPVGMSDLIEALGTVVARGGAPIAASGFELAPFDLDAALAGDAVPGLEILLVEDNTVNQELARRMLEKKSYRVTVANNGAEALECLEGHSFAAVLMDMQMPVLGGIEATEAIRAREMRRSWVMAGNETFRPAYIIAMTANAMAGDRERCLAAGMNDYIAKPVRAEQLYAALERAAGRAVTADEAIEAAGTGDVVDFAAAERDIGDHDLLVKVARMLLADWNGHLGRIAAAIAAKDAAALQIHAHSLKGVMGTFHAAPAQAQAAKLEAMAQEIGRHGWDECRRTEAHLGLELDRLRPVIERFVS